MSYFEDLVIEFSRRLSYWLLTNIVKIVFVGFVIGGWYLLRDNQLILGLIVEGIGLWGLDLSAPVVSFINKRTHKE